MSKEATASKPAARRGRPPGRTAYQEQKRRQTRAAILNAATEIFSTTPYVHATIDDIIGKAKISRATFYDHFESKLGLASDIYDSIAPDWISHFDRLAEPGLLEKDGLEKWIADLARLYVAHGFVTPLVEQLVIFEHSFRLRIDRDRDALIERLAKAGLKSFATALGTGHEAQLQRARSRLLLLHLDQTCGMIARPDQITPEDADAYIEVLAEELRQQLTFPPETR